MYGKAVSEVRYERDIIFLEILVAKANLLLSFCVIIQTVCD